MGSAEEPRTLQPPVSPLQSPKNRKRPTFRGESGGGNQSEGRRTPSTQGSRRRGTTLGTKQQRNDAALYRSRSEAPMYRLSDSGLSQQVATTNALPSKLGKRRPRARTKRSRNGGGGRRGERATDERDLAPTSTPPRGVARGLSMSELSLSADFDGSQWGSRKFGSAGATRGRFDDDKRYDMVTKTGNRLRQSSAGLSTSNATSRANPLQSSVYQTMPRAGPGGARRGSGRRSRRTQAKGGLFAQLRREKRRHGGRR